ncbi:MAG: cell envelope integrity protein TolA [Ectothiorhodospiraceae bacterium]|nr:cell envelope integrity protein TolA [Ectothiorhodospiraceae bacterium]
MRRWFGNPARGSRYLLYSLGVHVVAGALLFVNLGPMSVQVQQTEPPEIIHAVTVDQEEIESRLDAQRDAIAQAQQEEERRRQEAEEARRRAEEERRRQEEEARRQEEEERQRQQEAEQERQRQQERERQRREEEQRRAEEEQRRAEEQRRREEAERQRREEEQRRAEEERRRQEEAERQRREEEERRRQEEERRRAEEERRRQEAEQRRREEEMRQRMEEEQQAQAAQRAQAQAVNVWRRILTDAWVRPPGSAAGLSTAVRVRLLPTGQVISIEIIESSGDDAFDRSVRNAIERASPLPVPDDASAFRRAGLDNVAFRFMPDG